MLGKSGSCMQVEDSAGLVQGGAAKMEVQVQIIQFCGLADVPRQADPECLQRALCIDVEAGVRGGDHTVQEQGAVTHAGRAQQVEQGAALR